MLASIRIILSACQCVLETLVHRYISSCTEHKHLLPKALAQLHVLQVRQDLHCALTTITAAAETEFSAAVTGLLCTPASQELTMQCI
jgi:hypothetical protein